ncbi:hypothetical protein E2C01_097524 [Portunus trituberculatus]|uniref:Uncharacterized protein n=1 Tax=Portunus trituberculatus TaxID=210409 RepID=A0A5B7JYQ2_PORTR|nr:hypothetical protein [Portunus trituberculatus]
MRAIEGAVPGSSAAGGLYGAVTTSASVPLPREALRMAYTLRPVKFWGESELHLASAHRVPQGEGVGEGIQAQLGELSHQP